MKSRKVENMFVEKGWTVRTSKRRMKGRKVLTSSGSAQCGCCRPQSARAAPGGKDERTEKVAKWIQKELRYRGGELDRGVGGEAGRAGFLEVCSGACESVIDAAQKVFRNEDQEIRASKSGLVYASATVEEITNLGEVVWPMMTKEHMKSP